MKKPKTISPIRPNEGLEAMYRAKLDALVDEMHRSLLHWLGAAYKAKPPEMAQDADYTGMSPAMVMREAMRKLTSRWQTKFDRAAGDMAKWFSQAAKDRSDKALAASLRKAGVSVKFDMTREMNDVLQATIGEQVSLIKSIASQHLGEVEGMVMRSVSAGRDLGTLTEDLQKRYGITKRRAALIARDQNNKATANMQIARQQALGITEGIWMHSRGGKHPRKSHVDFSGQKFDLAKGAFLDGVWTVPGREIGCRCVYRAVVPGFD